MSKNEKKEKKEVKAEELKDKLFVKRKETGIELSEQDIAKADKFCEGYKKFLDTAKTEREACA